MKNLEIWKANFRKWCKVSPTIFLFSENSEADFRKFWVDFFELQNIKIFQEFQILKIWRQPIFLSLKIFMLRRTNFVIRKSFSVLMSMPHIESQTELKFARLGPTAIAPSKGSEFAAGFDLYSAHDYSIPAGGRVCAMTDIQVINCLLFSNLIRNCQNFFSVFVWWKRIRKCFRLRFRKVVTDGLRRVPGWLLNMELTRGPASSTLITGNLEFWSCLNLV